MFNLTIREQYTKGQHSCFGQESQRLKKGTRRKELFSEVLNKWSSSTAESKVSQKKYVMGCARGQNILKRRNNPKKYSKTQSTDHVLHLIIISSLDLVFPFHLVKFLSFILVPIRFPLQDTVDWRFWPPFFIRLHLFAALLLFFYQEPYKGTYSPRVSMYHHYTCLLPPSNCHTLQQNMPSQSVFSLTS